MTKIIKLKCPKWDLNCTKLIYLSDMSYYFYAETLILENPMVFPRTSTFEILGFVSDSEYEDLFFRWKGNADCFARTVLENGKCKFVTTDPFQGAIRANKTVEVTDENGDLIDVSEMKIRFKTRFK